MISFHYHYLPIKNQFLALIFIFLQFLHTHHPIPVFDILITEREEGLFLGFGNFSPHQRRSPIIFESKAFDWKVETLASGIAQLGFFLVKRVSSEFMAKLYVKAVPPADLNRNTEWFTYPGVWTTYILILFFSWILVLSVFGCSPGIAWTIVNLAHFAVSLSFFLLIISFLQIKKLKLSSGCLWFFDLVIWLPFWTPFSFKAFLGYACVVCVEYFKNMILS